MFESPMFVWIPMFFLFIPHLCGHTDQAEALESAAEAEQRDVTWWMVDDGKPTPAPLKYGRWATAKYWWPPKFRLMEIILVSSKIDDLELIISKYWTWPI